MECYYFGTFNPVHKGHIQTATDVLNKFGFREVIFVPAYSPCHKENCASSIDRFNMLKLIENDEIKVSDIEFKLPTPSYSYQTIQEILKGKKSGEKVNFIIGFDAFKNIEKWKNPEQLKENIRFIVLKRTGEDRLEIEKLKEKGFDFIITDNIDTIDISSSEIREKVKNGSSINGLVDEKVKRYIEENDLYRRNWKYLKKRIVWRKIFAHSWSKRMRYWACTKI